MKNNVDHFNKFLKISLLEQHDKFFIMILENIQKYNL